LAVYLDTSALVKLAVVEAESSALRRWLRASPISARVTSDLARAELVRAVRAAGAGDRVLAQARSVLARISTIPLSREVLDQAGTLEPSMMRTLDAIHLASALTLADQLDGFVTYDRRLAEAATLAGVSVAAPA
jgi:predicted nucleic acid-binding protein